MYFVIGFIITMIILGVVVTLIKEFTKSKKTMTNEEYFDYIDTIR